MQTHSVSVLLVLHLCLVHLLPPVPLTIKLLAGRSRFRIPIEKRSFLFSEYARSALRTTQPLIFGGKAVAE